MFLAIAVDNLADAESLTELEKEKEEEREKQKEMRRSGSKSPIDGAEADKLSQRLEVGSVIQLLSNIIVT